MDDRFTFGSPAKRPAKLGQPRPPGATTGFSPRVVLIAVGLVVAAIAALAVLRGAGEAGERIGDARSETAATIDRANDAAAQATLGRTVVVARTAWAEGGAFPTDPAALTAIEPSMRFTAGASTGPTSVAVHATTDAFAAAVRSRSGTCWWVTLDSSGTTAYGRGGTCTGAAAMGADAPSW